MRPNNRKKMNGKQKGFIVFMLALVVMVCFAAYVDARVGGGHGYSGRKSSSGRSGGGGGGGGGGEAIFYLIQLVFRYPKIGIPVLIIVGIIYFRSKSGNPEPDDLMSSLSTIDVSQRTPQKEASVEQLQKADPNFSMPLFLDFAHLLYVNIHQFAGRQALDKLSVYLSDSTQNYLKNKYKQAKEISNVVIGSCSISALNLSDNDEDYIAVSYETNFTQQNALEKNPVTYYERSTWRLARKKGIVSKGPGQMDRIGCTSCGAPLDDNQEGKCSYCGSELAKGTVTWYVKAITVFEKTSHSPDLSGGYAVEKGTSLPTRYHPQLAQKLAQFKTQHPAFSEAEFSQQARQIFITLQEAWTNQKWELARPLETDHLFQNHLYWINLYKRQKVRNVLKDINISKVQLAKVQKDAYFDAITVRIFASMIDYTATETGKVLGGNTSKPRPFSEYWTFIRRSGLVKKEQANEWDFNTKNCPNCGNSLNIGMSGKCEYCGSKITTGEFSWVVSQIQQDESYNG